MDVTGSMLKRITDMAIASGFCAWLGLGMAQAAVIINTGGGGFPGDSNVVFNPCPAEVNGPATIVSGCLNDDQSYSVNFTGNENLLVDGGQARVGSADANGFEFVSVSTPEGSFATFIVNIQPSNFTNGQPVAGKVEITPYIGGVAQSSQTFDIGENGSNFFSISTDNGDLFSQIDFRSLDTGLNGLRFEDFRQNRLGAAPEPTAVPEPASLALMGLGLAGFGLVGWRRRLRRG